MPLNSPIYVPKIIWCTSIENDRVSKYFKKLSTKGYKLEALLTAKECIQHLKANFGDSFIIITSEKDNTALFQEIDSFENVLTVLVFDSNMALENILSSACKKVAKVCTKFRQILTEVEILTERYLLKAALDCTPQSEFAVSKSVLAGLENAVEELSNQVAYYHFETGRVLDFKLISLLSKEQSSPEDILKELTAFLSLDSPGLKEIGDRFKDHKLSSFNILKEFCYVYSTELIYREFNRACASRSYHKVIKSLAMLLNELKRQQDRIYRKRLPLYRGVPKSCMKIEDYEKNNFGFWSSFTSTSRNFDIAREFAGEHGFVFVITLSETNPHPNVILDNDWSKYPRQEEVLLLPYFSLKTTKIEQKDDYTYIYVEQNESDSVLSLNDASNWTQRIEQELIESIGIEIEKMSQEFCLSIDIVQMLTSTEGKQVFQDTLKVICDQVLPEQEKSSWESKLMMINQNPEIQDKICQAFWGQIPEMTATLLGKLSHHLNLRKETKKSIADIIRQELTIRNDIYQGTIENLESSLIHTSFPWDLAVKQSSSQESFISLLKGFMEVLFRKHQTSRDRDLENGTMDVLWKGFCKNVELSHDNLNACSKDLVEKYRLFFSDTKLKLQNVVKGLLREEYQQY